MEITRDSINKGQRQTPFQQRDRAHEKEAGRGSQVCLPVGSISRIDRKKLRADLTPLITLVQSFL
jgi:hypothetical protein